MNNKITEEQFNEISSSILAKLTTYASGKDNGTTMKSIMVGIRICLDTLSEFVERGEK